MKIAVPTDDRQTVAAVFGRAVEFAITESGAKGFTFIEGMSNAERGAGTGAAAKLIDAGVEKVFVPHIGPKAEEVLVAAGIEFEIVAAGVPLLSLLK